MASTSFRLLPLSAWRRPAPSYLRRRRRAYAAAAAPATYGAFGIFRVAGVAAVLARDHRPFLPGDSPNQ
jgi:hypothetical protein